MNDRELRDRLHLLAARRLSLRPGAAERFRVYLESDAGAAAWRSCSLHMGFLADLLRIGMPTGPSENDEALLRFIDAWAKSHATLDDVEPLPALVRGGASLPNGFARPRELAPPGDQVAAGSDLRMKRRALVLKHAHAWPTIDADLRDGSRNGLSGAALDKSGRDWIEAKALEWAQSKGKLIPAQAPLPRQFHRLAR